MKYFSAPADFKKETLIKYENLNNTYKDSTVIETYGNITIGNCIESGRQVNVLPEIDLIGLQRYIEDSKERNIDFNYTLNALNLQSKEFSEEGLGEIYRFLGKLYKVGVRSLTITLPTLIELVKASDYDFKIKASTLCQITNASKARAYKNMGVDKIVLDESINRDFGNLKKIREYFGEKIEIIVNAICHKNCIYRVFHYNQMAADSIEVSSAASANYYSHHCLMQRYENIPNILRLTWVRPEDLKYYTAIGIHYFKLQGRQAVIKGDPVKTVECYFNESFAGNLLELLDMFDPTSSFNVYLDNKKLEEFIKPYVESEHFCTNNCAACRYCESFATQCIDYQKAHQTIQLAREFYHQYDQFKQLVKTVVKAEMRQKPADQYCEKQLLVAKDVEVDNSDFTFD